MQSKKRFTETNIWEAAWFMELTPLQKLFWQYINDRCDNIGIWEPNFKFASFILSIDEDPKEFGDKFFNAANQKEERVLKLENGNWFLKNFVKFQYCKAKPLSAKSPAHKSYIQLMKKKDMWEWFCENQPDVMPPGELDSYTTIYPKPALAVGHKESRTTYKEKEADKDVVIDQAKAKKTG